MRNFIALKKLVVYGLVALAVSGTAVGFDFNSVRECGYLDKIGPFWDVKTKDGKMQTMMDVEIAMSNPLLAEDYKDAIFVRKTKVLLVENGKKQKVCVPVEAAEATELLCAPTEAFIKEFFIENK